MYKHFTFSIQSRFSWSVAFTYFLADQLILISLLGKSPKCISFLKPLFNKGTEPLRLMFLILLSQSSVNYKTSCPTTTIIVEPIHLTMWKYVSLILHWILVPSLLHQTTVIVGCFILLSFCTCYLTHLIGIHLKVCICIIYDGEQSEVAPEQYRVVPVGALEPRHAVRQPPMTPKRK